MWRVIQIVKVQAFEALTHEAFEAFKQSLERYRPCLPGWCVGAVRGHTFVFLYYMVHSIGMINFIL